MMCCVGLAYGKSPMLNLVQSSILSVRNCRPHKFRAIGDTMNGSNHINVIFNEATTAGVLDALKGCTRLLLTEEGDVILKRMGAFLLPNFGGREQATGDDCRAQLINLYDHPDQYSKKLKNSMIEVKNSKLNILVSVKMFLQNKNCFVEAGVTGELIQRAIVRRAQNTLADALYERFLFWVLAGDAIATDIIRPQWDFSRSPTMEQFAVIMSFLELIELHFENDANVRMIEWCNYMKSKGMRR
jgi:hypothetical protein